MTRKLIVLIGLLVSFFLSAQKVIITGDVFDEFLEPFSGALIKASSGETTTSNSEGKFTLKVELPVTLTVSFIGYGNEKVEVTSVDDQINLILKENTSLEQVILSASRTPERLFESPVAIERISLRDIKRTPSPNFYEALGALKNVDVKNNSMLLQSVNSKGFSTTENTRFVQLVDGVENTFPTTNTSLGNMIGTVDMDVENVEIITGASSALYGANAFNGIMLIKTKNPFDYSGISVNIQSGINVLEGNKKNPFYSPNVRFAHKFDDYFAAKASFSYHSGKERIGQDYRSRLPNSDLLGSQTKRKKQYYNGLNVYGDDLQIRTNNFPIAYFFNEVSKLTKQLKNNPVKLQDSISKVSQFWLPIIDAYPDMYLSREGYKEKDLVDDKVKNLKFSMSLNYRPFGNEKLEISWISRFNSFNGLLTTRGSRVALRDASLDQHILDIKGERFFVRGYATNFSSGNSYNINALAHLLNGYPKFPNPLFPEDKSKELPLLDILWYQQLSYNFLQNSFLQGLTLEQVRLKANELFEVSREKANQINGKNIRLVPGSIEFNRVVSKFKSNDINNGGSRFSDNSKIYNAEGNYNFKDYFDFADILVGASFRRYKLNSDGNVFTDTNDNIFIDEYGIYTQLRKSFMDDRLKVTGSIRYDKSKNFDGNFSPRGTVTYAMGTDRNHFFRASVQSAFRNPRTLDQYIGISSGFNKYVIGNTLENIKRFNKRGINSTALLQQDGGKIPFFEVTGETAFKPGFTRSSFNYFFASIVEDEAKGNSVITENSLFSLSEKNYDKLKTKKIKKGLTQENVTSIELGYRSMIDFNNTSVLELDLSGYYSMYTDFIYYEDILIPFKGDAAGKRVPFELKNINEGFTQALTNAFIGNYHEFSVPTNSENKIYSYGLSLGFKTKILNNYSLSANYAWNDFNVNTVENSDFQPRFNMPTHNVKVMFGNESVVKNLGFNVLAKWQNGFLWQSDLIQGEVDARITLDAQITYKVPFLKSRFKLGGTNIFHDPYYDNLGSGKVGATYYLSWIIND